MARKPKPAVPQIDPLEQEQNDRLREARRRKESSWVLDMKECYFFAAPHRQRQISSQTLPSSQPMLDQGELNTDFAFLLCGDFVTEIVNTFMPEAQPWCERGRGMFVPEDAWNQIQDEVRTQDTQIFEAIKASNFYSEIPKAYDPDLAIGTAAVWIERKRAHEPIKVLAVPLREFEANLGPDGEIDDRFVVRWTQNRYVKALLPGVTIPKDIQEMIDAKPTDRCEIVWGFWRKWEREDDEVWQHVITIKSRKVHDEELVGEGCCPLIPARFNPSADWVWGIGPLMKGLPTLRQVDELDARKIEAISRAINPPITYPDDSFASVEQGFEDGCAYPIRPGSEGAVKAIYTPPSTDPATYELQEKEHRLQRLFFTDFPEQTGDTPPTLGQWLDEMARAQRRIGTPGMSFWREGPAQYFLRFKYLLEKYGAIKPLKVDGRMISARAMNPAQRAAEQQEIAQAVQAIQILGQAFPEEFKMWVDGKKTIDAFLKKMRVKLLSIRDPDTVDKAIGQISQLMQGQPAQGQPLPAAGVA